jgi:outer membrane protein assembly factor BamB
MIHPARILAFTLLLTAHATAANWPAWRGPDGQGHTTEQDLPLKWTATENVRWKVALPDEGNSTPVVWGDRIFVTQATDKKDWPPPGAGGPASAYKRSLLCLARADGKKLWERTVEYKEKESTHPTNPYCSASPVTDGERVIVSHGSAGMYCYDLDGKELWKKDLGKLEFIWGNAASPILYGDLAILWCGPGERQFLLAVNKKTGETVWEHKEPGGANGFERNGWRGSWSTPVVVKVGDHDELLLGVPKKAKAFDPKTGTELWSCDGPSELFYTSPVYAGGIAVFMCGFHGPALAVKAGGKGDVTSTHRLWYHKEKIPQRIGSPVIVGDHIYHVNEDGTAQCLELKTGKDVWDKKRLPGKFWGSLVATADGKLYTTSMEGTTFVLKADPAMFEELARNPLGERVMASIVISDGELFIRGYKNLWCIGMKK